MKNYTAVKNAEYRLYDRLTGKYAVCTSIANLERYIASKNVTSWTDEVYWVGSCRYHKNMIMRNLDFTGKDVDMNGEPKRYIITDSNGKIVDVRDFIIYNEKVGVVVRSKAKDFVYETYAQSAYRKNNCKFRKSPVPYTGMRRYSNGYYRRPKLVRTARLVLDPEGKNYSRASQRVYGYKLNAYEDCPRHIERNWKHSLKVRKQWMRKGLVQTTSRKYVEEKRSVREYDCDDHYDELEYMA